MNNKTRSFVVLFLVLFLMLLFKGMLAFSDYTLLGVICAYSFAATAVLLGAFVDMDGQ